MLTSANKQLWFSLFNVRFYGESKTWLENEMLLNVINFRTFKMTKMSKM